MDGVVLFSGGLDSLTTLVLAKKECKNITTLFFNYGQNTFEKEESAVKYFSTLLGANRVIIDITYLKDALKSPYTTGEVILDNFYVPNRNLLLLTIAHAYAQSNYIDVVYTGLFGCSVIREFDIIPKGISLKDRAYYIAMAAELRFEPERILDDGKDYFMDIIKHFIPQQSEDGKNIAIKHPLQGKNKSYCFSILNANNLLTQAIENSYSCYNLSEKINDWGVGCGECVSCLSRESSYKKYTIENG